MTPHPAERPVSVGELAVRLGCELIGSPDTRITHVATLGDAGPGALSFLANPRYAEYLGATRASAVILAPANADDTTAASRLVHPDPYGTYARAAAWLYPGPSRVPGCHASADVAAGASVAADAEVGAFVTIGEGSTIASGARIGAGTRIGRDVTIGANTSIAANVCIADRVAIGERCRIQSGAVIGSDGFGFAPGKDGWTRVPQVGGVRIGDDVDIGANTTIDRGAIDDTVIEDDVRLDNLVQIAHNVRVGAHTAMAAQCGIAGSTVIGERCMFAGQSGAVGHVRICADVVISGKTMVTKDINEPGQYGSALPHMPMATYRRVIARIRQIDKLVARVAGIEKNKGKSS